MTERDLQERAAALFVLAEGAFGEGKDQLGNELTALALQYLDQAQSLGSVASPPPTVHSSRQSKPQQPLSKEIGHLRRRQLTAFPPPSVGHGPNGDPGAKGFPTWPVTASGPAARHGSRDAWLAR
jgi:hypothetical protein